MAITVKDVEHVALLSRLEVNEDEKERYARELSKIFAYVEELGALDTEGIHATAHPLPMSNVFREDVVIPPLTNAAALSNAPEQEDGCFKVPQIV